MTVKPALLLLLAVCCCGALLLPLLPPFPHALADPGHFKIETVADSLRVPWAIDFAPDGRIFFTERGGNIRVIGDDGTLASEPVKELDVGFVEGGLLGIALDPDFEDNHYVYVYYTYTDLVFTYNKVVRFTEIDNELTDEFVLIEGIPGGPIHNGGRIKFADDQTLYIATGDAGIPGLSQDAGSTGGKILRINPDGSFPADNPFGDSAVFSLGHRNPQGLDWDPDTGKLVVSEHGPSGERGFAHDEINVVEAGQNYGWPEIVGDETGEDMQSPVLHSGTSTWAPSGAAFYDSDGIAEFSGRFLVATLAGKHLRAIDMDLREDNAVAGSTEYFLGEYGRLRDVATDGRGNIYILTSNRDGRGSPAEDDDRILRLSPVHHHHHHAEEEEDDDGHDAMRRVYEPPGKQLETVSDIHEIRCYPGLSLVFKDKVWSPACVKPESIPKLVERGWASDHLPEIGH